MGVAERKFNRHIKSLMHFDYPYFAEPGDGCRDEIGVLSWEAKNNAIFVGVEAPVAQTVAGTPKFGYRCLQTSAATDYLEAEVSNGYLDMNSAKKYEFEFFIRKTNASAGNIINLLNSSDSTVFAIATDATNKINVNCSQYNIAATSSAALTLNTWTHVRVRIADVKIYIYVNGTLALSSAINTGQPSLSGIAKIRVGGFIGQLDEFMIRHSVSNDNVPARPYAGYVDTYGIGGDGHNGTLNITSGTNLINSGYLVQTVINNSSFTWSAYQTSIHGVASVGDEIMIWKLQCKVIDKSIETESGLYAFRKIKSIDGTTITLDSPITEFNFSQSDITSGEFAYLIVVVPNYQSVTVASGAVIGGTQERLIVMRCKGNVTINGTITNWGYGKTRYDYFQMTHSHLPERFIYNLGGGIIILSEGTVTAGAAARIGATWSGAGKGGAAVTGKNIHGNYGGAGYGGSGGVDVEATDSRKGPGGYGGVGGGGAGSDNGVYSARMNVGATGLSTGGASSWGYVGGTQGIIAGGNAPLGSNEAGGGALGCGNAVWTTTWSNGRESYSGSNVLIICKEFRVDQAAISTGGERGLTNNNIARGAGGTGMCYLAYKEAK